MQRGGHALFAALAGLVLACGGAKPPPASDPNIPAAGSAAAVAPPVVDNTPVKAAAPPSDPALLTCKNVERKAPAGVCGILEKAPRADAAAVQRAVEIWKRVESPFHALSGRESALVVLSPDARTSDGPDGTPIPPAAYICPGAPPTVFVPATLLALVDNKDPKKYPDDFLAFVLGHELGHRMNDLTPDGCQLAAFQRPGKGANEEELADARSAFFITSAGFSASKIARGDMVSRFLEAEYALGREDSKTRKDALLGALSKFDAYEALYQTSLSVAMMGEMEAADRLLTWADELVQSHGVPLPELRVVRAITRIHRAAEMAPWLSELGMPVGIDHLRCTPVHPGHSGLYEEPDKPVRGPDIERGRKLLKEALVLLGEAEARGATPFTVAAARACANLYLADAAGAAEAQERAESLMPTGTNAAVKQTLADNHALVTFLQFARKKQAPGGEDSDVLEKWTDELEASLGAAKTHAGLTFLLAMLRNPRAKPALAASPTCAAKKPAPAFAALPMITQHGSCPKDYKLVHALPSLDAAKNTGSTQGITVCQPVQGPGSLAGTGELVAVRLTATTEPPLAALERTMLTMRPPAQLAKLDAWACQCAAIERQGVSDRGEVVYRVQCPSLKLDRGVLIVVDNVVQAMIQHSR